MHDLKVYYVGNNFFHYSKHSGYGRFSKYLGKDLKIPIKSVWMNNKWGIKVDNLVGKITRRPHYPFASLLTEFKAFLHMLFHKNSIYHVIFGDMNMWLLPKVTKLTGNHLVATFHEPIEHLHFFNLDQRILKNLSAAIILSKYQMEYFKQFLPEDNIFIVPHGIDTDFFCPAENRTEEDICITVGYHLRDYWALQNAMKIVWESKPKTKLIAIGTYQRSNSNPILDVSDQRIIFYDDINDEDLRSYYQKSKLAVFTFKEATANNSVIEAMACGLPIVSTKTGGIVDYVNTNNGILCEHKNPKSIAEGILSLLANKELSEQMGVNSRLNSLNYDFKKIAEQTLEVYREIT